MNALVGQGKRVRRIELREFSNPTKQRLEKAEGHYVEGGSEREGRIVITMRDAPIDKLHKKGQLSGPEHTALCKYRHHWAAAGLEAGACSIDFARIYCSDPASISGMAKTENQAHHRKIWREAREMIGHHLGIIVDNVVCAEVSPQIAGHAIGYVSPYRARQYAIDRLCSAGRSLARWWGIG